MYNAAKLFVLAAVIAALSACSSDNSRRNAAAALVDEARSLSEAHMYDSALVVLDTLNVRYRDCLDERREGTLVRLSALASLSRDSLAAAEIQLRAVTSVIDSLSPIFTKVDVAGTEGYYVEKSIYSGDEMGTSGIQVRVDDQGYCFVVANVEGRSIGLNSISFGEISTPPLQSVKVENSEIMSVTQEPATKLLDALAAGNDKTTVNLVGTKGKISVAVSAKQRRAIADTWEYARALQRQRLLNIRLEKLERQIARLSDQLANQIPIDEE